MQVNPATTDQNRTIYCLRAHRVTQLLRENYARLESTFGHDNVYVLADATSGAETWPKGMNVLELTQDFLEAAAVHYRFRGMGWRCGDYCYYLAAKNLEFEYLWMIEADVYFDYASIGDFFLPFADLEHDFIGHRVRQREPNWYWHASMSALGHTAVYGSFFPLTRIHRSAIQFLWDARRRLTQEYESTSAVELYPNDEAFTATTLINGAFSVTSLEDVHPDAFAFFQYADKYCMPDIISAAPSPKVIHSALDDATYMKYVENRIHRILSVEKSWVPTVRRMYRQTLPTRHEELSAAILRGFKRYIESLDDSRAP